MRFFKNKPKTNSLYLRTYALILLPTLLLMCYSIFVVTSYTSAYRDLLQTGYSQSLSIMYSRLEDAVQNTIKTVQALPVNGEIIKALSNDQAEENIQTAIDFANQIKEGNSLIDSVFIVDSVRKKVFGTMGISDFTNHFVNIYQYVNYEPSYWRSYQMPFSKYKILPPSRVNSNGEEKIITPIVFTRIDGVILRQLVIVNINDTHIFEMLAQNELTENTRFLLINKLTRTSYEEDHEMTIDDNFYKRLLDDNTAVFNAPFDGEDSLIITYAPSTSTLGYSYAAVIPSDDIDKISQQALSWLLLLGLVVIGSVLLLILFSTRSVYKPVHMLATMAGIEEASPDPISNLRDKITEMQQSNEALAKKVSDIVPLAQEHRLTYFLNSDSQVEYDGEVELPGFDLPDFCTAVIKLIPTEMFYDSFNTSQYQSLFSQLRDIIYSYFSEKHKVYIISGDLNTLYVLINTRKRWLPSKRRWMPLKRSLILTVIISRSTPVLAACTRTETVFGSPIGRHFGLSRAL